MKRGAMRPAGPVSRAGRQRRQLVHCGGLLVLGAFGVQTFGAAAAAAAPATDALSWLARASAAARNASYSGVYVYSCAGITETARVTRLRNSSGDAERIESLDGTRREVVRRGDEIHYLSSIRRRCASTGAYPVAAFPTSCRKTRRCSPPTT